MDLNSIPDQLIDRVETVVVGGAPIYGADAIAGTVNIILNDRFEGFSLQASSGMSTEHRDGEENSLSLVWGKNLWAGKGNVAGAVQYASSNDLAATSRPESATVPIFLPPVNPESPYELQLYDNAVLATLSTSPIPLFFVNRGFFKVFGNGIPLDISNPSSPLSQFDSSGNLIPFVLGAPTSIPTFRFGGDGFVPAQFNTFQTRVERFNANLMGSYAFDSGIGVSLELWAARADNEGNVVQPPPNAIGFGGLPLNGPGNVGSGPIPIPLDNPFLTTDARATIERALNVVHDFNGDGTADPTLDTNADGIPDTVGFWRDGILVGPRDFQNRGYSQDTYRAVVGLDGSFEFADQPWYWDVVLNWGQVKTTDASLRIYQSRFEQAVQVTTDADGQPVCVDPSNGCVPYNALGTPSAASVNFFTRKVHDQAQFNHAEISLNAEGDLWHLPAGPLAVSVGASHRQEKYRAKLSSFSRQQLGRREGLPSGGGQFESTEYYLETVVPLLGGELNTPWVDTLEFEGAIRRVHNSVAGSDITWTAGLRYRPIASLELRGNRTESIRAPSIGELFAPETAVSSLALDPCDANLINDGPRPKVRVANCAAQGISQPFTSTIRFNSLDGSFIGNSELSSEIAESLH
ncbi:MAG: TonB-dependent receptor [Pseudomonadota bacterium]